MTLEQAQQRYSAKRFDPEKKLSAQDIQHLKEIFRLAPSSINVQGWQLLVAGSDALKQKIADCATLSNPHRIREASHILIFCRKTITRKHMIDVIESTPTMLQISNTLEPKAAARMRRMLEFVPLLRGKNWLSKQVYLALGFVMAACAAAGIDSLAMEGFHSRRLAKVLGLAKELHPYILLAVGYAAVDDKNRPELTPKGRLPLATVVKDLD